MEMGKIICSIIIIALGSWLLYRVNLRKNRRYMQGIIPLVAALSGTAASLMLYRFVDQIIAFAGTNQKEITQYMQIFLVNIIVMAIFILLKIIMILILKSSRNTKSADSWLSYFYEFDTDYNEWFLQNKWCNVRKLFFQFNIAYTVFTGFYLGYTWTKGNAWSMWLNVTPVILLMITIEIYNFLNGYTKVEFEHSVMGDESYSQRISNFYRIREIYEKLFPAEVLAAYTGCEFTEQKGITDLLKEMEESQDNVEYITSEFFSLQEGENRFDADYIQAVLKLMKKENVIFFNPFYKDLEKYIILPLIHTLISNQKCLIMLGRNSTKEDIQSWIEKLLKEYCRVDSIWRVEELTRKEADCEVGILCFNELYDIRVIDQNKDFLEKTGFVFILEPSLVINTGQIGFSIVANQMRESGLDPVYCIADRMVDGLVDTMSHLLHEKITEVIAPPVPRHIYTGMAWNSDGDYLRQSLFEKQTRYLGNGMELSAVAVKNQIPKVTWISETKTPMRDLKWIVGQYFTTLCKYMNLPAQQQSIYEKIDFSPNLWSLEQKKEQFLIVDDEFCNMFAMMRIFLSRAKEQVFANIMSENYLLRDYMRCNAQIFMSNPNVIPSIVPDYAKTERNTILKLMFMMAYKPLSEHEIRNELELIHYPCEDVLQALSTLVKKYTFVKESAFVLHSEKSMDDITGIETEMYYSVSMAVFEKYLQKTLKNAYYVVENEDRQVDYIDAKLFSQVIQTVLPGQFVVYDGKYYKVNHISVDSGVILRRAADLYDGRKYYRQIRKYYLDASEEENVISHKKIMDLEMTTICMDFHVETVGYLEMDSNNDLRNAREVDLSFENSVHEMDRAYKSKNVLRLCLPETTNHERFTICLLLTEMFRSVFPNTWQYLAVMTDRPDNISGMLNFTVYELHNAEKGDYIYIVEDSDLDLGLLEAIEKNFMRFMEIISDFIEWHFEKMREPAYKDPVRKDVTLPEEEKRKKGIAALLERIAKIFGVKKEEEIQIKEEKERKEEKQTKEEMTEEEKDSEETGPEETESKEEYVLEEEESSSEENPPLPAADSEEEFEEIEDLEEDIHVESEEENAEVLDIDGTDIFDTDADADHEEYFEKCFEAMGIEEVSATRYQKECYLKYGFLDLDERIELDGVNKYLNARGFSNSDLTKARKRQPFQDTILDLQSENCCDFCGLPISGVSYERMNDGRIRCNDCSVSAINTVEEFRQIFQHILATMQSFFGIEYKVAISVKMVDARVIARGAGMVFKPSKEYTARVLGYAQYRHGNYSLLVENGSPRLAMINTMVHEMTHIWQYLYWDDAQIKRIYGDGSNRDLVYEGMAMWASIQYLYLIGETSYAMKQELIAASREDVYGVGFNLFREKYPIIKDSAMVRFSPFTVFPPI